MQASDANLGATERRSLQHRLRLTRKSRRQLPLSCLPQSIPALVQASTRAKLTYRQGILTSTGPTNRLDTSCSPRRFDSFTVVRRKLYEIGSHSDVSGRVGRCGSRSLVDRKSPAWWIHIADWEYWKAWRSPVAATPDHPLVIAWK